MITCMRRTPVVLALTSLLVLTSLTGCRGEDTKPASEVTVSQAKDLPKALVGFPMKIARDDPVDFSSEKVLDKSPALTDLQTGITGAGAPNLRQYAIAMKDELKIDVLGADSLISVGNPPNTVTLLRGGQDGKAIKAAAKKRGWTGKKVLSKKMDASDPISVPVGHIKVAGDSVYVGAQGADLNATPGTVPRSVKDLATCLGNSPVANSDTSPEGAAAVTVGLKPGTANKGVICALADSASGGKKLGNSMEGAAKSGLSLQRQPYTDLLTVDKVSNPTASTARLDVTFKDVDHPMLLVQMLNRRDLPGLQATR
jgi:hypothetical protein